MSVIGGCACQKSCDPAAQLCLLLQWSRKMKYSLGAPLLLPAANTTISNDKNLPPQNLLIHMTLINDTHLITSFCLSLCISLTCTVFSRKVARYERPEPLSAAMRPPPIASHDKLIFVDRSSLQQVTGTIDRRSNRMPVTSKQRKAAPPPEPTALQRCREEVRRLEHELSTAQGNLTKAEARNFVLHKTKAEELQTIKIGREENKRLQLRIEELEIKSGELTTQIGQLLAQAEDTRKKREDNGRALMDEIRKIKTEKAAIQSHNVYLQSRFDSLPADIIGTLASNEMFDRELDRIFSVFERFHGKGVLFPWKFHDKKGNKGRKDSEFLKAAHLRGRFPEAQDNGSTPMSTTPVSSLTVKKLSTLKITPSTTALPSHSIAEDEASATSRLNIDNLRVQRCPPRNPCRPQNAPRSILHQSGEFNEDMFSRAISQLRERMVPGDGSGEMSFPPVVPHPDDEEP